MERQFRLTTYLFEEFFDLLLDLCFFSYSPFREILNRISTFINP